MKQVEKSQQKSHSLIHAIIVTLILLIGLSLLLYPAVVDYINSLDYKKYIEDYQQDFLKLDDTARQELLTAANEYNAALLERSTRIGELTAQQRAVYKSLLDPAGNGMMGYIEIEKIGIYLPVYHGTGESVLQTGIGHVEGSSLPVGGVGTRAILSGHTGLPSSELFSKIDQLKKGDVFELHILGEILTYQVESAVVLLPEEAQKQEIDPQRDLCTLMTCTPYGINTHRLLVTGTRIETPPERLPDLTEQPIEIIPAPMPPILLESIIGLPVLLVLVIVAAVLRRRRE